MARGAGKLDMTRDRRHPTRQGNGDTPDPAPAPGADKGHRYWADQDEDVRLMLAFQAGEESAFAALVQRNQSRVYAVVHRFMAGRADAEDIAQEVFLRVFRSAHRYSPEAKFSTWLYRIAANLCINALRKRGRLKLIPLNGSPESTGAAQLADMETNQPDERLRRSELAEAIRDAIEQLPENQRVAMILHRYEQMSYQQIGEILGCSPMAVKSLMSRARGSLRDLLADHLKP